MRVGSKSFSPTTTRATKRPIWPPKPHERLQLDYRRVFEAKPGKHQALNAVLPTVTTPIVVTVDADTYLHREALTLLVARFASTPQDQHVCACAGLS